MNSTTTQTSATKYVAYYRVSTRNQNLGLDAQQTSCKAFAQAHGAKILAEYVEKESGKEDEREELNKAVALCKSSGAVLLVAKLDRLTRHVKYGFELIESGLRLRVANLPELGDNATMMLSIFLGMAQQEREYISQRTRSALAELKQQGKKLGRPDFVAQTPESRANMQAYAQGARAQRSANARNDEHNKRAYAFAKTLKATGARNAQITRELNTSGFKTPRGKQWTQAGVARLFKMYNNN